MNSLKSVKINLQVNPLRIYMIYSSDYPIVNFESHFANRKKNGAQIKLLVRCKKS